MNGDEMTEAEQRLLKALALMAAQYLETGTNQLDHLCMTAGERAIQVLSEYGLVTENGRARTWTEAGREFLNAA